MSNWRNFDGNWINLDFMQEFYVRPIAHSEKYQIMAIGSDGDHIEIIKEVFNSSMQAQICLNNIMVNSCDLSLMDNQ